jgi:SAM-dependent methyltransferase
MFGLRTRDRGRKPRQPKANLEMDRYQFAFEALRTSSLPSKLVFDVGAGDGRMRRIETLGFRWRGFAQTAWQPWEIEQWDLTDPCPAIEKAGAVLLLDVIEHCLNPGLALKNISQALLPGGRLIVTTPNPRWSASRLHNLLFGWPSGFTCRDIDDNHHVFPAWPHILEKLLGDADFAIEEYVTLDGQSRLFRHRLSAARVLIESFDHSACGMSYAFVARKFAH